MIVIQNLISKFEFSPRVVSYKKLCIQNIFLDYCEERERERESILLGENRGFKTKSTFCHLCFAAMGIIIGFVYLYLF